MSEPIVRRRRAGLLLGLAVLAASVIPVAAVEAHAAARPASASPAALVEQATSATTVLRPIAPCRLFDTRQTPDAGRVDATTWRLQVAGRCGVPADARAVSISIVATSMTAPGFLTVWPSGSSRPNVSNLNYDRGNTVANSAVVRLGASGSVDVYTFAPTDVIIDVTAAFVAAPAATGAGRFVPVAPDRLIDTRSTGQRGTGEIRVPLPPGVPADATAVAVSITAVDAVDAVGGGYLTAYPAGTARPNTSVVNTDRHNPTRANAVFVPVTGDGFMVFRYMTTDVLVDFWGWFSGASAPPSTDGLFVPQAPVRAWDSRATHDPIHGGGTVEKLLVPPSAAAVVANVTAVDAVDSGFMSVYPAGTARPGVSSLNYRWRQPVAALTVARSSNRGVSFYSYAGAHVLVDVAGWFTGPAAAPTLPPPTNPWPAADTPVIFVSDSAFAGIRWNGALGYLQGAVWDNRLESCRRLIGASCRGREGYAPRTALAEIQSLPYGYEVAIIATGYNDYASMFPTALDAIVRTARTKGIERIVWLSYRENVGYVSPSGISYSATFAANNRVLRAAVASGEYPELILADWHTYTGARSWWLTADGVHLTGSGARAAAEYVSRKLAALERRPCPAGIGGATTPGGWCADPDITGPP